MQPCVPFTEMAQAVGPGSDGSEFNYDFIVRYFGDRAHYTADDVALAAHTVYSWMPTMMGPLSERAVLQAYAERIPHFTLANAAEELATFRHGIVGNSWIGTSKALHVMRPAVFPIWDSRVARVFGLTYEASYNNQPRYLDFIRWVQAQVNTPAHTQLLATYKTPPVRTVEFILYQYGKEFLKRERQDQRKGADRNQHEPPGCIAEETEDEQ